MHKIFQAKAARSGASITITGQNLKGEVVKLAGVVEIQFACGPERPHPVATMKDGTEYALPAN